MLTKQIQRSIYLLNDFFSLPFYARDEKREKKKGKEMSCIDNSHEILTD